MGWAFWFLENSTNEIAQLAQQLVHKKDRLAEQPTSRCEVVKRAFAYFSNMPFLPVTPAFFAALHDASVERFVFEAARGRLLLTLLLDSDSGPSHRQQQVVLSGIRTGAEVERLHRLVAGALSTSGRTRLGYRLEEFCLLPLAGEEECPQGRLSVRLAIDHLPPLQLRCEKITSQEEYLA